MRASLRKPNQPDAPLPSPILELDSSKRRRKEKKREKKKEKEKEKEMKKLQK